MLENNKTTRPQAEWFQIFSRVWKPDENRSTSFLNSTSMAQFGRILVDLVFKGTHFTGLHFSLSNHYSSPPVHPVLFEVKKCTLFQPIEWITKAQVKRRTSHEPNLITVQVDPN